MSASRHLVALIDRYVEHADHALENSVDVDK